jgi:hypothetical protein
MEMQKKIYVGKGQSSRHCRVSPKMGKMGMLMHDGLT